MPRPKQAGLRQSETFSVSKDYVLPDSLRQDMERLGIAPANRNTAVQSISEIVGMYLGLMDTERPSKEAMRDDISAMAYAAKGLLHEVAPRMRTRRGESQVTPKPPFDFDGRGDPYTAAHLAKHGVNLNRVMSHMVNFIAICDHAIEALAAEERRDWKAENLTYLVSSLRRVFLRHALPTFLGKPAKEEIFVSAVLDHVQPRSARNEAGGLRRSVHWLRAGAVCTWGARKMTFADFLESDLFM